MDGDEANRLFRQIICGIDTRLSDEAEVAVDMQVESFGQIPSLLRVREFHAGLITDLVAEPFQLSAKRRVRGVILAAMDRVEQLAKECQKTFSVPTVPLIGMIDLTPMIAIFILLAISRALQTAG